MPAVPTVQGWVDFIYAWHPAISGHMLPGLSSQYCFSPMISMFKLSHSVLKVYNSEQLCKLGCKWPWDGLYLSKTFSYIHLCFIPVIHPDFDFQVCLTMLHSVNIYFLCIRTFRSKKTKCLSLSLCNVEIW